MRPTTMLLLAVLLATSAPAQEPDAAAGERYQELASDWQTHRKAFFDEQMKAVEKAKAEGATTLPPFRMSPPLGDFLGRAKALAADWAGREEAVPFLLFLVENGRGDDAAEVAPEVRRAVTVLMKDHLGSPRLDRLARLLPGLESLLGADGVKSALERLRDESGQPVVAATAVIGLESERFRKAKPDSEDYRAARAALVAAQTAVEPDSRLAREIQGMIDLREKLEVGATAPDIAGVDLDGEAFKLSDYRGRIILLDFWGDW